MKFNKNTENEQEIRGYLTSQAFGSFLGMELHLSVVNTILGITTRTTGDSGIERMRIAILKKDTYQESHHICKGVYPNKMELNSRDKVFAL